MNALIPILQHEGKPSVLARMLYRFLELDPANFSHWSKLNIVKNPYSVEGEDWMRLVVKDETPTGGKIEREDYALTLPFAKKLAMMSRSAKAELIRDYFIACEQQLNNSLVPASGDPLVIMQQQALQMAQTVGQLIEQRAAIARHTADIAHLSAKLELFSADTGYLTVRAYAKDRGLRMAESTAKKIGFKAAALCRARGIAIGDVPDEKYGKVHSYPREIIEEAAR